MAAAQASRHNCAFCGAKKGDFPANHVCPGCQSPQPIQADENYFVALGLAPRFHFDKAELEQRFYQVSRILHPDRFTTANEQARRHSLERMSLINEAYRTLKDPALRRPYLLGLLGGTSSSGPRGSQVPAELAESWFQLQDSLVEEPALAEGHLRRFEEALRELRRNRAEALAAFETELDQELQRLQGDGSPLLSPRLAEKLAREIQSETYLGSMERDVERIKKRLLKD